MTDSARLRITLLDLDPAPWREVEVPLSMTLRGLHDTIQAAFLWFDCHMWEFEVAEEFYGLHHQEDFGGVTIRDAGKAKLSKLLDGGVREFLYTYDMGDSWEHGIEVLELFDMQKGTRLPRYLQGQWRCPPEDIGGVPGFEEFLAALSDPKHQDHAELMEWHEGPFDPEDLQQEDIEIRLKRLAMKRRSRG